MFQIMLLTFSVDEPENSDDEPVTVTPPKRAKVSRSTSRGRGRGRVRGRCSQQHWPPKGYDDLDTPNQLPSFSPQIPPGLHLTGPYLRSTLTKAVDFFKLFFTTQLIQEICNHTNMYG